MAAVTIVIPSFDFSGFYFPDLLINLRQFTRVNVPEITDESDEEPFTQILRACALIGHLNNVLLDIVANETLLPTARLLESVRSHLKLIDFKLKQASPAIADVVYEFSKVFTTTTLIVPKGTQSATEQEADTGEITFEAQQDYSIVRTDRPTKVYIFTSGYIDVIDNALDAGDTVIVAGVSFVLGTDFAVGGTAELTAENIKDAINASTNPAIQGRVTAVRDGFTVYLLPTIASVTSITVAESDGATNNFSVRSCSFSSDLSGTWSTVGLLNQMFPTDPRLFDSVYIMHSNIEWDRIDLEFDTPGFGIRGVFEFYDGSFDDDLPDTVVNLGANLQFKVNQLLSPNDQVPKNRKGSKVRVTLNSTGAFEDVYSTFDGTDNYITTEGLLGQAVVDTDVDSYTVGTDWNPVVNEDDQTVVNSERFGDDDFISFDLPDSLTQNWIKAIVNGDEGYWLRFRITDLSGVKATGSLTFVAAGVGVGIEDGDTVTIDDGLGNSDTYEFDTDASVEVGNIAVTITASATASAVRTAFLAATASGTADVTYTSGAGTSVDIVNNNFGSAGNVPIVESISNLATLTPVGMSGGENLPTVPILDILKIDEGGQYLKTSQSQGETQIEDPLGSSNGQPDQSFNLTFRPMIEGSLLIEVDEGSGFTAYNLVDNFLNSTPASKDYILDITADDVATVTFGNGTQGKIPPNGVDNIRATYRIGADVDGNVGALAININKSGIAFVNRVFNPRQALGWTPKEGSTDEDLARLKIEGPASLRTKTGGITLPDFEFLTRQFVASTGSRVVERALGIEETFGVKTIEVVVAGFGGSVLTDALREEIEDYFNGNKDLGIEAAGLSNHEVTVVNYTPRVIDVTATITTTLTQTEPFVNAIKNLLSPSAKFDDGVTYRWDFGALVPRAIIIAELFDLDPFQVKNVQVTTPLVDTQLLTRELPVAGTVSVTLVAP